MTIVARIEFYSTKGDHGFLSNFAAFPVTVDGRVWPTSEHCFQAQKFSDSEYQETIRQAQSPMIAARLGRSRKVPIRPDWEQVREDIMATVLRAKFAQHESLRQALLATGDALLIEHTKNDRFGGDGGDGSGRNCLGELLMRIRSELRAAQGQ
jgi:N-glycosidase YbiA